MTTAELRALLEKATAPPWHASPLTEMGSVDDPYCALRPLQAIQRHWIRDKQEFAEVLRAKALIPDMALIAAAVNALPALLDDIDALRGTLMQISKAHDLNSAHRYATQGRDESIARIEQVTP